jgi:hypothetical protein
VLADIATPQFPARGVIDPQDPNDLAPFVHFKDDTVRLMENLPQSPGPERRLGQQRAATRALFQRKERIQQAVPPPFGPEGVIAIPPVYQLIAIPTATAGALAASDVLR